MSLPSAATFWAKTLSTSLGTEIVISTSSPPSGLQRFNPITVRWTRSGSGSKHEKIIHIIRLNKIVLIHQDKPGALSLFDNHFFIESVIVALAVAIDDAKQSPGPHGLASSFQQANRLSNFVVGF